MSNTPVLSADTISVSAPGTLILDGISLDIPDTAISVLAGPVGAGKSVLARVLGGILKADNGSISGPARGHTGVVLQNANAHLLGATVEEDIHLSLARRPDERTRRTSEVMSLCGISHLATRPIQHLSGGEARLCALAATMATSPRLLICDEPFANLDWSGVDRVLSALISYTNHGGAVLAVTHETEKILAHAQRLFVLQPGGPVHVFRLPDDLVSSSDRARVEAFGLRIRGPVDEMSWLKKSDTPKARV